MLDAAWIDKIFALSSFTEKFADSDPSYMCQNQGFSFSRLRNVDVGYTCRKFQGTSNSFSDFYVWRRYESQAECMRKKESLFRVFGNSARTHRNWKRKVICSRITTSAYLLVLIALEAKLIKFGYDTVCPPELSKRWLH